MTPQRLTEEELEVVSSDAGDLILLEVIKGMCIEEMRSFDVYSPIDFKHYTKVQISWLRSEKHLLLNRPCNCQKEVPEELLIEDFDKCHNGERCKVFYVLKYPSMVHRLDS